MEAVQQEQENLLFPDGLYIRNWTRSYGLKELFSSLGVRSLDPMIAFFWH